MWQRGWGLPTNYIRTLTALSAGFGSQSEPVRSSGVSNAVVGCFLNERFEELDDLASLLSEKDQTISYFGLQPKDLRRLVHSLPMRAIDRIVPIGTALDFSAVWDGNNLLQSFSREIDLND